MTQTPTDALRLVPDEEQIFAWLNRKYVQRAEERQRSMNLQYICLLYTSPSPRDS